MGKDEKADISAGETLERRSADIEDLPTAAPPSGTRPTQPGQALTSGQSFGGYRLLRCLGKGGFGQVWEAESLSTGRRVALKALTAAPTATAEELERFRREGRLAASLNHPHCVYVFGAEQIESYPVLTMELMPGGTLQDRLRRDGPLPYREAVDCALQIADALEAAAREGVIHRDIKPSNCLLDATGAVRVADFGLSKTLEADPHLTATGTFMGTPAYSSPEQIRARDVDFRTDLYSLGATLYALLTGKPPYSGDGTEALARILTEPPEPFPNGSPVPRGLQRIVLRLLAKDKTRRYASYAALRSGLLPFSSQGLAAGGIGRRFAAILVDFVAINAAYLLLVSVRLFFAPTALDQALHGLLLFAYFAALEVAFGQTLGKRLTGLRVVSTAGGPAPPLRLAARSALFASVMTLPSLAVLVVLSPEGFLRLATRSPLGITAATMLLPAALLVSTMRRGNGLAALHEIATGTRVMVVRDIATRAPMSLGPSETPVEAVSERSFGPYRMIEPLWETETESLVLARDPELQRRVWIHLSRDQPSGTADGPSAHGRLQWLQSGRQDAMTWKAWEAPSGRPLGERLRSAGPLTFDALAPVLIDVCRALASDDKPRPLGPSHVWLTADGGGKLLDFSITGEPEADSDWRAFVRRLLFLGLDGIEPGGTALPRAAFPERARAIVQRICGLDVPYASSAELAEALVALGRPVPVTRLSRFAAFAVAALLPVTFLGLISIGYSSSGTPLSSRLLSQSRRAQERLSRIADPQEQESTRQATVIVQAFAYTSLRKLASQGPQGFERNMAMGLLSGLSAKEDAALREAVEAYPDPSPSQVEAARRRLDAIAPAPRPSTMAPVFLITGLVPGAVLGLLLAPVVRGAPLLALFGVAVQRRDGERVSRGRALLRAAVVWAPLLVGLHWLPAAGVPLLAWVLISTGIALLCPERTLADRLAGTRLVPR